MANEIGQTELAATQQDIINAIVQDELKTRVKLAPTILDFSSSVGKGMKTVAFPKFGSFAAEDKTENTDLTNQVLTATVDQLLLDKKKAILASVEEDPEIQSVLDMDPIVIDRMMSELALEVDEAVYAELKLASTGSPDHRQAYANSGTDNNLGKVDILDARRLLKTQNAKEDGNWYLAISPSNEQAVLSINDFVHADTYGSARPIQNGEIGRIYGFNVIVSNVVEDLGTVAYHKDSCIFAMQQRITFRKNFDLPSASMQYLGKAIFGAKVLQDGKLNVLLGSAS